MQNSLNTKHVYDLERRTQAFAQNIRNFVQTLPRTISNIEDVKQLVRSSGSIGANYIEANESLSKKDKEAKESKYWLDLINVGDSNIIESKRQFLHDEAGELTKIFGAIIEKSK